MNIFIVPKDKRYLADEIIQKARNSNLSLETSKELAEEVLRRMFRSQPKYNLIPGHQYGILEVHHGCYAWRNGKQLRNVPEIYLCLYQVIEGRLWTNSAWGGITEGRIRPQMVLFEM